jgi:hypothetical protein
MCPPFFTAGWATTYNKYYVNFKRGKLGKTHIIAAAHLGTRCAPPQPTTAWKARLDHP